MARFITKISKVLNHLKERGSITQREAATYYDAWRLSAVIFTLKGEGHDIETKPEKHKGGTHARYHYHGRKR